ncbi:MAG: choline transporter, partial [Gammaproteobacteria bacterium]|nr:choline transporter [Gammaproteobacteria bacterium]
DLLTYPTRSEVETFVSTTAHNAMRHVADALKEKGWPGEICIDETNQRAFLEIVKEGEVDFIYDIRMRGYAKPSFVYPEQARNPDGDEQYYRAEVFLRRGGQAYDIYGYDEQEVIDDILSQFEKYLHFLHISPGILPWKMEEHDEMLLPPTDEEKPA